MEFTAKSDTTFAQAVDANPARAIAVEVGDAKQEEFYPQFKSLHWDNECNFSARLVDAEPTKGEVVQVADKIEWSRDGRTARFYQKESDDEGGAFEFEVELAGPPASNVLEFSIQTKGLDFFFQPPLTELEIKLGSSRPENVVGSYAVYHSTKQNNVAGGKEYRSGKAFHIYRPWAEDAKGNRVWCDLKIDESVGLLRITIPQEYLNAAVYPLIVDPTFGYTSIGASETGGGAVSDGCVFTAPEAGTITQISAYNVGNPSDSRGGIYADSSGSPAALLATSSTITIGTSFAWHDYTVSLAITSGTPYWLAECNASGRGIKYDAGSTNQFYFALNGGEPVFANPANPLLFFDWKISIYATYTASGGGTPTGEFFKMF